MTTADAQLALRPPVWARAFLVAWPLVVLVVMLREFRPGDAGSWFATIGFCLVGTLMAWRLFQQAALGATDGGLVVRNVLRSRTVDRADVADVAVERSVVRGSGSGWSVLLRLRDGSTLPLDVTRAPLKGPGSGSSARRPRCASGSRGDLSRSFDSHASAGQDDATALVSNMCSKR